MTSQTNTPQDGGDELKTQLDALIGDSEDFGIVLQFIQARERQAQIDALMRARNMVEATWKTSDMVVWFMKETSNLRALTHHPSGWEWVVSRLMTGGSFVAIDDWFFRVLGKGVSVQPVASDYHKHLYSTRHAKIQPLHVFGHCWRVLL